MNSLVSFPSLITFFIFVFMIWRVWKMLKTNHTVTRLPPGPWKLPIIGNMHNLFGSLPHHCLEKLARKYGPIMHLQLGEISHVVVSSPEIAQEFLINYDSNFAQRPKLLAAGVIFYNFSDIAFSSYGNYWRQLRKICTLNLLSGRRVKSFQFIREEEISNLIRSVSSNVGSPINLSKMVSALTIDITARAAFGDRCKDKESFLPVAQKLLELIGGFSVADFFPSIKLFELLSGMRSELNMMQQEEDKILGNIIFEHRASRERANTGENETEDLVDVLLNIQENGDLEFPLTTDNIKAVILDIFTGGTETSSTAIEWAMSELLKNPRVLEKVQAEVREVFDRKGKIDETDMQELNYLNLVIKETLRLHPPLPLLLPRECIKSCKIKGYDFPLGTRVIVNAWAIGRDPRCWTEPERFYPERFLEKSFDYNGTNLEYMPFGAGRRMCPGMSFGMSNVELSLAHLLFHFNWELPNGVKNEDLDMTEAAVGRKNELYLVPSPYDPHSIA